MPRAERILDGLNMWNKKKKDVKDDSRCFVRKTERIKLSPIQLRL